MRDRPATRDIEGKESREKENTDTEKEESDCKKERVRQK